MKEQFSIHNSQLPVIERTLVALSGGVDSAVAAALTLHEGHDCAGAVMKLYNGGEKTIKDARSVADHIGIPLHVFDFTKQFAENVITPFISEYKKGRTPNPCVYCNKHLKFGCFLTESTKMERDFIATGHYAQVQRSASGRYLVKRGADAVKDQSYVLYTLTQEQLSKIKFPLGGLTKSRVREIALDAGLSFISGSESQDICFIPDGDYARFITEYTGEKPSKGRFIDKEGNVLGENKGVISYTVGQRRGLGLSMPHPTYVLEIHPQDDTVVIGKDEYLYSKSLTANSINLIPFDKLDAPIRAHVRIRYKDPGHPATVHQTDTDTLYIEFDEPKRAITKGQAAVIYDSDTVIGGGIIA